MILQKLFRQKALVATTLGLLTAAATAALQVFGFLHVFDLNLQNWLYAWQLPARAPSPEIVLVAIDDKSLAAPELGRWQEWRRAYFATAISHLQAARARVIGVDVTFSEPSRVAGDDDQLAAAVQRAGNVVLVARTDPQTGPVLPLEKLAGAAGLGFANFNVGPDNTVRESPLFLNFGTESAPLPVPAFALAVAELAAGRQLPLPPQTAGAYLLNFFGRPGSFAQISFVDVFQNRFAPAAVAGKIVLIGATPADLRDLEAVPVSFGQKMAGVEIHANALQTLLGGHFLQNLPRGWQVGLITLLALVTAWLARTFRALTGVLLLAGLAAVYVAAAYFGFAAGWVFSLLYPLLAALLTFLAVYLYRFAFADRAGRELKTAFRHYLAPDLVEQIAANPDSLQLGGQQRELTIFFSDIAGFTQFSEQLRPTELVKVLNKYLGKMTEIVLETGGTLDKYIGDAVMAFWGAPLPLPTHAVAACQAALAQQAAIAELQRAGQLPHHIRLEARMGLHTGEVVVGNMGSTQRFSYTAMGDAVNLASRLEGVNKYYGTRILISEDTYRQAAAAIAAREVDAIRVKGKQKPVAIYELVALAGQLSSAQIAGFAEFAAGLAAYRAQNWDAAEKHLHATLRHLPADGPSQTLLERIAAYRTTPPPPAWDGVFTLTTK